jgi:Mrp family chromosome partitioning ATPase
MRVIVTTSENGGTAKTPLTASITVVAALTGDSDEVGLMDYHPRGWPYHLVTDLPPSRPNRSAPCPWSDAAPPSRANNGAR